MKMISALVASTVLYVVSSAAISHADIIVRTDGTMIDGKVKSKTATEVVLTPDDKTLPEQHITMTDVSRVILTNQWGAVIPDPAAPKPAPKHWNVPPEPVPPPVVAHDETTYYLIPLHGEVGDTVLADTLEKSLADALTRKPTVVVLDINSPGGLVSESEKIMKVLHEYNSQLRMVALADQDLSAAAIFSLSIKEIYLKPTGTIGAAVSFQAGFGGIPLKVDEKFNSAWRAVGRSSAEEGGHEPLLANAMIDNTVELHLETVDGKPVIKEGQGDKMLCRLGKIFTLTSHEAVECGLAAGTVDNLPALGRALHLANWTECRGIGTALVDYRPKLAAAYQDALKTIGVDAEKNLKLMDDNDPSNGTLSTRLYAVGQPTGPGIRPYLPLTPQTQKAPAATTKPSGPGTAPPNGQQPPQVVSVTVTDYRLKWKIRSLACIVATQDFEQNLRDAIDLSKAFSQDEMAKMLKDELDDVVSSRIDLYGGRNKFGSSLNPPPVIDQPISSAVPLPRPPPRPTVPLNIAEKMLVENNQVNHSRAAQILAKFTVDPAERAHVEELLTPFLAPVDDADQQVPFVVAFAHWADKPDVPMLVSILETPKQIGDLPKNHDHCWAAAIVPLMHLDPAAAEKVVQERKAEFYFRTAVGKVFQSTIADDGPDKTTAQHLLDILKNRPQ